MLQQDKPDDFVIATGVQYSVRDFITWTAVGGELMFVEVVATPGKGDSTMSMSCEAMGVS